MSFGEMMMKSAASKALVIKINLLFCAFFLVIYIGLLVQPPYFLDQNESSSTARCSARDCLLKKVPVEAKFVEKSTVVSEERIAKQELPYIFQRLQGDDNTIGLININQDDEHSIDWKSVGKATSINFERVSNNFEWKDLFPEWIDEEEENEGPMCPEIPMPDFSAYEEVDIVVAEVPCRAPNVGWARDVFRLQVHLVVANMAARRGARDRSGKVKMALKSECRPMMEIFRCDDVVAREGKWWMFEVEGLRLEEKVALPIGSCKLALPLWQEGTNKEYDVSEITNPSISLSLHREAYATVLHSSNSYVCGAITLAQSIIKSGSTRDLILLHDASIPQPKLDALASSGWKLHQISRIRNPHAEKDSYNEYNYSKLRLWQLTHYRKIVFIDSDIVVLRNLDLLFHFPQLSAVGNDGVMFNSGIMVIEPSNCTFKTLMRRRKDVISYNGGDQGFLNEVFVWWHRLPRRVNFLKNFWSNKTAEEVRKNALFGSDPPKLYAIHYLGMKPWLCHREYDCNWNIVDHKVYASDVAHKRWWKVHDEMDARLKGFCRLSKERKVQLKKERKKAERLGFGDGHWRIKVE